MSLDTPRTVKAKGEYAANLGLGGLFTWTVDQDNGVLVNAAREGLGYELSKKVIEMDPFYVEGINIAPAADDEGEYEYEDGQEEESVPADENAPHPGWNASTVCGANWGAFETVSWKGHNYQVKWWSCDQQPDENCTQGGVWTDPGAY